jgi:hypothetical protein
MAWHVRSYRGLRTRPRDIQGGPGTWEPLPPPSIFRLGTRNTNSPLPTTARLGRWEQTQAQRWYRQAKATKRGGTDGRESEHLIVALKRGNGPSRTLWSEGGAASQTEGRPDAEDTEPRSVSPQGQRTVRGTASDVTSPMREIRTSGSVGALGSNPQGDPAFYGAVSGK